MPTRMMEEGKRHNRRLQSSSGGVNIVKASTAINSGTMDASNSNRGRTRSTGRSGGGGCPESPTTSATESSTDTSSSESRQSKRSSGEKQLMRSRSRKSLLYPPPPPPPPPPLRFDLVKENVVLQNDKGNGRSIQPSRSRSLDPRQKQHRDGSKSRQQLLRPTSTRTSSSKESSSRSSPTQLKSGNGKNSRSLSRSTYHRDEHHPQTLEQNHDQRQQRTSRPSSGRSASRAKEMPLHHLDGVDSKSSSSTANTKPISTIRSKSPYSARGKSIERNHSAIDITPSPCARQNLHRVEHADTTSTAFSSTKSSSVHRNGNGNPTHHSRTLLPTSNTVKLDKYGCCIHHPIVQLQRPNSNGRGGWRILSQTCALRIEEAKKTEQKRAVPSCSKIAKNECHQLEQDHSKFNTTTARRRSVVHEASCVSTDASLDSSPQDEDVDEEECSITLSCLEFDGDEPSAITSSTTSSVPMKQGSKSPAPNRANKSTVPSSYPSSDSPSVSAASQKSHKSCSSKKSSSSHRSATCREKDIVGRSSSETVSKKSPKPSVSSRRSSSTTNRDEDNILYRAEAALRRIKMLEKMGDRSAATSPLSTKEKTSTTPRVHNDEASQERHRSAMPRQANSDLETKPNRRNSTKSNNATKSTDSNLHPMNDLQIEAQSAEPQTMAPVTAIHLSPEIMTDYHQPPQGHNKEWMKYATTASARDAADENDDNGKKGIGKLKGRTLSKLTNNTRRMVWKVKQMPYCDQFGDHGIYTGHVNDDGKPDGSGTMKYENGVFYEGTWTDGCQDAAAQYARIRSGFTSWSGKGKSATRSGMVLPWNARKNDANDANEKNNVRGMEWMDLKGHSGRYTGEVNQDQVPHGNGIMKYDFGLIAEGEWVRGVLKEGPHDHLAAAIGSGQSVVSGMQRINSSLSLGSRSVGFPSGAVSAASGGMSVYMPQSIVGVQQFMPSQHAVMAHQNAMMSMYGSAVGSVYGGAANVYSSPGFAIPVQQMQYVPIQQQQEQVPPVSNIFI